MKHWHHRNR